MAEWMEVMSQFDRMCSYYQRKHECPMGCPMSGVNISQCRKIAFECPDSVEETVMSWAAEHPEPVYPTWGEWFTEQGYAMRKMIDTVEYSPGKIIHSSKPADVLTDKAYKPIPADIAEKLGIEPKEISRGA